MEHINATQARNNLYKLIDTVGSSHKQILITGKKANAILVSQSDWDSILETLHLVSIPGMRESVIEGLNTPVEDCSGELDW